MIKRPPAINEPAATSGHPLVAVGELRMRRVGGCGLTASAIALSVVALMVSSPGLFYMSTAIIATILAGRLQAWLAVRALRIERIAPSVAHVGELITVETIVWSLQRIRRPLISITDDLPSGMAITDRSPSLPIAPAFDHPIRSQYRFRPLRRGRYAWGEVTVVGSDALGLVSVSKEYRTAGTELLVVPSPVAITLEAPLAGGLGISEAGSGQARGGMEPRGIREFAPGDSIRHVHWRSSARVGALLVKEFEAGSQALFGILLQMTSGSDYGPPPMSSLDLMCAHALYLAQELSRGGAEAVFPQLEWPDKRERSAARVTQIETMLAEVRANSQSSVGIELAHAGQTPGSGNVFYVMVTEADSALPGAIAEVLRRGCPVTVLIYDPGHFRAKGGARNSAADPTFVDALTNAGAITVIIPLEHSTARRSGR
ncbi:MAG: DUF58 domain-containing protein [Fimbriimonadaceae bacterium]